MTARWKTTVAVAAAVLLVGLAAGACSSRTDEMSSSVSRSDEAVTASPTASGDAVTAGGGGAAAVVADQQFSASNTRAAPGLAPLKSGGDTDAVGRLVAPAALQSTVGQSKIVKTAVIHVEVGEGRFARQFSEAATIASTFGGFVASSTSAAGDEDELDSGTLVIRVPAENFDKARGELRKLGDVRREQLSGDDVGAQLADIDARLRNLRAQEEAIRALMAKAKDVNETLTVQNQLSTVRGQIEELVAQQTRLNDQVAYSTVTLNLTEPGVDIDRTTPGGLAGAWQKAVDGAEAVLGGTIVSLGYLLPLAVLVLVAALVARAVWRLRPLRRTEDVALSTSAGEDGA